MKTDVPTCAEIAQDLGMNNKNFINGSRITRVFIVLAIVLAPVAGIVAMNVRADREYAAYEELQSYGATGDDWVGLCELVTGRPPVVQLWIPETVPKEVTFRCLPHMIHLEALRMEYESYTDEERRLLARLGHGVWK